MKRLLIGTSVLAVTMLSASGAWANPENIFSDYGYNYVDSYASTIFGNAISESYNTNQNAISYQDLEASSWGNTVESYGHASVDSGSASVTGGNTTSGISVVSANSGNGSVVQQGVSLSALGTVNVGN